MNYKVTTQPAIEPITLAEAKLHLRVDSDITAEDSLIAGLIKSARQYCESYQNRALITQTITAKMNDFPCRDEFDLPMPELVSVTSIKYIDSNGVQQTLSTDVYSVDTFATPGRVVLNYNQSWPSVRGDYNSVEVVYVAGYGDEEDVPQVTKQAMLLIIGHLYENREETMAVALQTIPTSAKDLLNFNRIFA